MATIFAVIATVAAYQIHSALGFPVAVVALSLLSWVGGEIKD